MKEVNDIQDYDENFDFIGFYKSFRYLLGFQFILKYIFLERYLVSDVSLVKMNYN